MFRKSVTIAFTRSRNDDSAILTSASGPKQFIALSCGDFHVLALTKEGEVMFWLGGSRDYGQCGPDLPGIISD